MHWIVGPLYQEKLYQINTSHRELEMPINVFVSWSDEKSMTILKKKVKSINYPCDMDYVDDSKKILKDLLGESMEEDEKQAEVCETSECDRDQRGQSEDII